MFKKLWILLPTVLGHVILGWVSSISRMCIFLSRVCRYRKNLLLLHACLSQKYIKRVSVPPHRTMASTSLPSTQVAKREVITKANLSERISIFHFPPYSFLVTSKFLDPPSLFVKVSFSHFQKVAAPAHCFGSKETWGLFYGLIKIGCQKHEGMAGAGVD